MKDSSCPPHHMRRGWEVVWGGVPYRVDIRTWSLHGDPHTLIHVDTALGRSCWWAFRTASLCSHGDTHTWSRSPAPRRRWSPQHRTDSTRTRLPAPSSPCLPSLNESGSKRWLKCGVQRASARDCAVLCFVCGKAWCRTAAKSAFSQRYCSFSHTNQGELKTYALLVMSLCSYLFPCNKKAQAKTTTNKWCIGQTSSFKATIQNMQGQVVLSIFSSLVQEE